MSFAGDYTVTQNSTSTITLTDTSVGSDPALTGRKIYLRKYNATTLVPDDTTTDYIVWEIDAGSITLTDILKKDWALNINVVWDSDSPITGSTYDKTQLYLFKDYAEEFNYGLIQEQSGKPYIINDDEYFKNLMTLRVFIDSAIQATVKASDQFGAQLQLDFVKDFINDPNTYF